MTISKSLIKINIKDVDISDHRYKISFSKKNIASLVYANDAIEPINPPIVRLLNNKYIIVSGFNKINACMSNKKKDIVVYKINDSATDLDCLLKSISYHCSQRDLTRCELIRSVKLLSPFMSIKRIAESSLSIFNKKLNLSFVEDLLNFSYLPALTFDLIDQNKLGFNALKKLSVLSLQEVTTFLEVFAQINASISLQLEIINYALEISKRDNLDLEMLF